MAHYCYPDQRNTTILLTRLTMPHCCYQTNRMPQYCYPEQQNTSIFSPDQQNATLLVPDQQNTTIFLTRPTWCHNIVTQNNRMPHYCYPDQQNATLLLPRPTECHTIATQTITGPPRVVFHCWDQAFRTGRSPKVNSSWCREHRGGRRLIWWPHLAFAFGRCPSLMVVTPSFTCLSITSSNRRFSNCSPALGVRFVMFVWKQGIQVRWQFLSQTLQLNRHQRSDLFQTRTSIPFPILSHGIQLNIITKSLIRALQSVNKWKRNVQCYHLSSFNVTSGDSAPQFLWVSNILFPPPHPTPPVLLTLCCERWKGSLSWMWFPSLWTLRRK
jgi:hypothetical protein